MRSRAARFIGLTLVALTLAGCSSAASVPAPHAAAVVDTSAWKPVSFSGTGRSAEVVTVPKGARSLEIEVACSGSGLFSVSFAIDQYGSRDGGCGGAAIYRVAVPASVGRKLGIQLRTIAEVPFAYTVTFSPDRFVVDPTLSVACDGLTTIASSVLNADEGYRRSDETAEAWSKAITAAATRLGELEPQTTGIIHTQIPLMIEELKTPGIAPGTFRDTATRYAAAVEITADVCANGGSEFSYTATYGG